MTTKEEQTPVFLVGLTRDREGNKTDKESKENIRKEEK